MPNRTEGVKTLVEEVLATLPTPYSEDVIDEVFLAIEANPTWLTVYNVMRNDLGVTVVNQAVGSWTSKAVGRTGNHQVPARSKLTESYSKLYPVVVRTEKRPSRKARPGRFPSTPSVRRFEWTKGAPSASEESHQPRPGHRAVR